MYTPLPDGIEKSAQYVEYTEAKPPHDLDKLMYCFWELKTVTPLTEDFYLHAVPDACVDVMFNELDTNIAGVTALRTTYEVLNLGKEFHYVGVQFLPGVWRGNRDEIANNYIGSAYTGNLPLIKTNNKMIGLSFDGKQSIMAELVRQLARDQIVIANEVTAKILTHLDDIHSVANMAEITGVTPRQLQRPLQHATGFAPHDFLKVLRLQQAMKQGHPTLYTDQSHFIRSFRAITGYTPAQYFSKFDV
jgi:AraC-like DNA-binding protein